MHHIKMKVGEGFCTSLTSPLHAWDYRYKLCLLKYFSLHSSICFVRVNSQVASDILARGEKEVSVKGEKRDRRIGKDILDSIDQVRWAIAKYADPEGIAPTTTLKQYEDFRDSPESEAALKAMLEVIGSSSEENRLAFRLLNERTELRVCYSFLEDMKRLGPLFASHASGWETLCGEEGLEVRTRMIKQVAHLSLFYFLAGLKGPALMMLRAQQSMEEVSIDSPLDHCLFLCPNSRPSLLPWHPTTTGLFYQLLCCGHDGKDRNVGEGQAEGCYCLSVLTDLSDCFILYLPYDHLPHPHHEPHIPSHLLLICCLCGAFPCPQLPPPIARTEFMETYADSLKVHFTPTPPFLICLLLIPTLSLYTIS
ncbi:unnamed protein product [Chrysoparadoxa australica]